jgi:hypothetical protein
MMAPLPMRLPAVAASYQLIFPKRGGRAVSVAVAPAQITLGNAVARDAPGASVTFTVTAVRELEHPLTVACT